MSMTRTAIKCVLAFFASMIGTASLIFLLFGDARLVAGEGGGDSWRNFIYDFQTLIGGGAAVIAAWYTVRQMQITDEKSDTRHRELISLQLRPDRLRVERMIYPALADLEDTYRKISEINLTGVGKHLDSEPQSSRLIVENLERVCFEAVSILARKQFKAAQDLFDGDLTYRYGKTYDDLQNIIGACQNLGIDLTGLKFAKPDPEKFERAMNRVLENLEEIQKFKSSVLISFGDLNVSLETMRKEYHVHL